MVKAIALLLSICGMILLHGNQDKIAEPSALPISHSNLDELKIKTGPEGLQEYNAYETYRKGLLAYELGNYEEAIGYFTDIQLLSSNFSFTADNQYYLICALQKAGKWTEYRRMYNNFLSHKELIYTQSTYYPAVLMEKAQDLIRLGKRKEAQLVLSQIATNYANGWIGEKARVLMNDQQSKNRK